MTPTKFLLTFMSVIVLFASCHKRSNADLQGTWKLDSVYSFYNGFDMTNPGQEPLYHFQTDGRLRMTQDTEFRYFTYKIQGDSLTYSTLENKRIDGLLILKLNNSRMVLKKTKAPLFKSTDQQRYEIKYFSKIE